MVVQSRGELALFAGSLSVEPEPSRSMETPNCHFVISPMLFQKYHSSPQRLGAAVQQPRFKLFPL